MRYIIDLHYGDSLEIPGVATVRCFKGRKADQVKVAIQAPRDVTILREELLWRDAAPSHAEAELV